MPRRAQPSARATAAELRRRARQLGIALSRHGKSRTVAQLKAAIRYKTTKKM